MINAILGQKIGQTQRFSESGDRRLPVTVVLAGPCTVVWVKDQKMQIAFGERKTGKKPVLGHVKKAGLTKAPLFLAEVALADKGKEVRPGDKINPADLFAAGDIVEVTGISRGMGFSGVVKRWHFAGGPRTHGQSDRERAPGSIGSTTTPGRVYKGKKMAGRFGNRQVTVKNLKIFHVDRDKNLIYLVGLVPGAAKGRLIIKKVSGKPQAAENVSDQPSAVNKDITPKTISSETPKEEIPQDQGGN